MKLKDLITKALNGAELNALERAELEKFDPDALKARADEAERARLSHEEALQRDLDAANAERETLQKERDALVRRNRIGALAADSGCTDPDYLDFLARKAELDLDDEAAVREFLARTERETPYCFRSRLKPGTGAAAPVGKTAGNKPSAPDRIGAIAEALVGAPEAER